jgi:hypothetical protein
MKTREEIIKDISIVISAIANKDNSNTNRRLAAIEGMLVVLGKLDLNQALPLKTTDIEVTGCFGRKSIVQSTESYKECILRLAHIVICEQ